MEFNHYIISAEKASERRSAIERTFREYGITPRFFNAIMGNKLSEEELQEKAADKGLLTLGEIGCGLSHLEIHKKFLTPPLNSNHIFVFEDDIVLQEGLAKAIPAIESFVDSIDRPMVMLLYKARAVMWPVKKISDSICICRAMSGSGAYGYVINRKAAENILQAQTPIRFEIDAWAIYAKLNYLDIYCLNTDLVRLNEVTSANSLIDAVSTRKERSSAMVKRIKDGHVRDLYNRNSFKGKVIIQGRRLQRHIQEFIHS